MPDLTSLASALAAATGPDRALDERLAVEVFGWSRHAPPDEDRLYNESVYMVEAPAYTASLDAIAAAIEARWDGIVWTVQNGNAYDETMAAAELVPNDLPMIEEGAATPALALCLAAVRLAMGER